VNVLYVQDVWFVPRAMEKYFMLGHPMAPDPALHVCVSFPDLLHDHI
jgi:hypothetical protein